VHPNEDYIALLIREFRRLKKLADRAIAQTPEKRYFETLDTVDNSLAAIIKHVSGNMQSRWTDFLTTDGEKPDRNRDEEFIIRDSDSRQKLTEQWERGWAALFDSLSPLSLEDLDREVKIRGEALTVLQAANRQLTHYAYHVGQIVFLAKHLTGEDWKSLSIPIGQSQAFNEKPDKYAKG